MTAAKLSAERMPIAHRRGLSVVEAATYCGVSVDLFRRECDVVPVKIGHRVLYLRDRLDAWLDGKAVDARKKGARDWTPEEVRGVIHATFTTERRPAKAGKR